MLTPAICENPAKAGGGGIGGQRFPRHRGMTEYRIEYYHLETKTSGLLASFLGIHLTRPLIFPWRHVLLPPAWLGDSSRSVRRPRARPAPAGAIPLRAPPLAPPSRLFTRRVCARPPLLLGRPSPRIGSRPRRPRAPLDLGVRAPARPARRTVPGAGLSWSSRRAHGRALVGGAALPGGCGLGRGPGGGLRHGRGGSA